MNQHGSPFPQPAFFPFKKLHSTDEVQVTVRTEIVGSSACVIPTTTPEAVTQTCGVFVKQVVFLTMNYRRPLPLGNFTPPTRHEYGQTLGELEPVYNLALPEAVAQTYMWHLCGADLFLR